MDRRDGGIKRASNKGMEGWKDQGIEGWRGRTHQKKTILQDHMENKPHQPLNVGGLCPTQHMDLPLLGDLPEGKQGAELEIH